MNNDDHFPGHLISVDFRGHDHGNDVGWILEVEAAPQVSTMVCENIDGLPSFEPNPHCPPNAVPLPTSAGLGLLLIGTVAVTQLVKRKTDHE